MKKRLLSIVLTLCMVLMLVPQAVFADGGVDYLYCDANGANWTTGTKSVGDYTPVTSDDDKWTSGWYVATGNITIGSRVTVSGNVHLILADGCKLTVNGGIQVQDDDNTPSNGSTNALTIYGQSTDESIMGTLIAQDTQHHSNAAIGGNNYVEKGGVGGTVTINGGTVTATSAWGTGIGGGYGEGWGGSGGTVTINGGFVEATSNNGAGIGGGNGFNCGSGGIVIINGGTVKAESHLSAGIGGGGGGQNGGDGGKITINGGTVTATSTYYGAGIGGGGGKNGGSGGTVIINDGIVKAKSAYGVGIGGGGGTGTKGGSGGTITINGGIVEAASAKGAGIGGGSYDSYDSVYTRGDGAIVTITGGTVKAESSTFKANEGDSAPNYSYGIYAKNLTISDNADVTATGGKASTSYGIYVAYTSDNANSGSMTISGNADVTATGGKAADSIGIIAKNLTVKGGSVKAKGGEAELLNSDNAVISYGIYADKVIIYDGTVEAEGGTLKIDGNEAASGSCGIQGSVNINSGSVTATGGSITGSGNSVSSYGISGSVTITGGHVTAQTLDAETTNASRYALGSKPTALPSAYWWRTAANGDFTASTSKAYSHSTDDTYVEFSSAYTITLDPNYEGSTSSTVTTGADGKLTSLPTPTRDGYTFAGWFTDATNGTEVTNKTGFSKNTTIYAHWTAVTTTKTYTVTLYTNGGTIGSGNITAYTYGVGAVLPTDVTRAGYTFAGWYASETFTGDPVTAIGADATGEKAYWAKWVSTATPDYGIFIPQTTQNGWKSLTAGSVYYKNGVKVKGLQQIDGETYYFDEKGYLQTGWVELDGDWYYFDAAMQTGWLKQGNTWYYLDPRNGAMAEDGMQEIDGATYYFYDWGGMASNFWYLDEKGDWYYFGGDGAMVENKWVLCNGLWYYLGSDGEMLAEKWLYWNGEWYYLGSDGAMLTNTTTPDGYYVGNDGVWVK